MNEHLQTPLNDYRPLAFWSLNDRLDPEEMRRQIHAYHRAGWGGVYVHARDGLVTTYMGAEWMEAVRLMIDECRALGMTVWIYDEDRWPSGFGGDMVTLKHPEFRQRALVRCKRGEALAPAFRPLREIGDWVYCAHIAAPFTGRSVAYPDLMNPRAVQSFLEEAYEPYRQRFGTAFGNVVPAIFMDEPQLLQKPAHPFPALPWTDVLPQLFEAQWGYDLLERLDALFENVGDFQQVRHNFWRVVEARFIASFHQQIYAWCDAAGVRFCGHMTCEESLYSQLLSGGTTMAAYPHFHIPGIDTLERKTDENLTIKQCVSVARQYGKKDVLSEMFGLAGQGATPADFRWICDWNLVNGVNVTTVHLNNYSLRGQRKRDCPPTVSPHQPYWPHLDAWSRHTANAAALLTEGDPLVDVLVLFPIESSWANVIPLQPGEYFLHNHACIRHIQMSLYGLMEGLIGAQLDFDLGCEAILAEKAKIVGDALAVGAMRYRVVVIPECDTVRASTLALLQAFAAAGGTLVATGNLPRRIDGRLDPRTDVLQTLCTRIGATSEALEAAIGPACTDRVVVTGTGRSDLYLQQRRIPRGRRVFLFNRERRHDATVTVRIPGLPDDATLWQQDTELNVARPVSAVVAAGVATFDCVVPRGTSLCFDAGDAAGVVLHAPHALPPCNAPALTFDDAWRATRRADNVMPLFLCQYRKSVAADWSVPQLATDVHKEVARSRHRGPLWLRYTFESQLTRSLPISLIVEDGEAYAVVLNGVPVTSQPGTSWMDPSFRRFDVGALVRSGTNEVELCCDFRAPNLGLPAYIERNPGIEIEPLYLLGDFSVDAPLSDHPPEPPNPLWNCTRLPTPRLTRVKPQLALFDRGDLTAVDVTRGGAPFYCGEIAFERTFEWQPQEGEAWLDLGEPAASTAEIRVNGTVVGARLWAPYALDISSHLRPGCNTLEVRLTNTLRNLFNGHHRVGLGEGLLQYHASTEFCQGSLGRNDDDHVSHWAGSGTGTVRKAAVSDPSRMWKSCVGPADEYRLASFGLLTPVTLTLRPRRT